MRTALIAIVVLLLTSASTYADWKERTEAFVKYVKENPLGMTEGKSDYWLEEKSPNSGRWVKLILVFGYWDNWDACDSIRKVFDYSVHRCTPAN